MVELSEYKTNFLPHPVPDELVKLVAFDAEMDGYFSQGFELAVDDKGGIKTWSTEPAFIDRLFPIGQANGSGSTYALWQPPNAKSLTGAPVVVFGDEGGVHVVAGDIKELLRILTYDTEPMIDHDGVTYYKDEDDHEDSDGVEEYAEWLSSTFKLKAASKKDVEAIVKNAQKDHGRAFAAWMKPFYDG